MKKIVTVIFLFISALFFITVSFASDIPCSPDSKKLEYFSCHMFRKPYKEGLKTQYGQFCEEVKKLTPVEGCAIKELTAEDPLYYGGSKDESGARDDGMYIFIIGPASVDSMSYQFQIEPKPNGGIIPIGTDILDSLPGFTVTDMPGKSNNDRATAYINSLKKKGKKFIGGVSFSAARQWSYPTKKTVTAIKYKDGNKLYEIEAEVIGYKQATGSIHGGNSDKSNAGNSLGNALKGLFNR